MAKNEKTKATNRNMRSKKDGSVLNANHVTMEATREGQSHIDATRFKDNGYWRFESDGTITAIRGGTGGFNATKHEIKRYRELFGEGLEARNERYIKNRNKSRCQTIEQLYRNPKTAPLESLWQIGNSKTEGMPTHELRIALFKAWSATVTELKKKYGDNIKFLDAGLHMEEKVPHIHSRMVLGAVDEYGHFMPNQTQAFKDMGIERQDPTKPQNKYNSPLIAFSDMVREMFYQNCERQGIQIDREVQSYSHRQKELLEYQCEQFRKEMEAARAEAEIHKEAARVAQEAIKKTMGDIKALTKQISHLEADKAALEAKIDYLVTEKNELKTENNELKTENQRLRNDKRDLESQIADLERQHTLISTEIVNLEKDVNRLQVERDQAQADKAAAIDGLRKIEEHQKRAYGQRKSPKIYETQPAQKEKKNLRGQVVQEARPECVVVSKKDFEEMERDAAFNVSVKYNQATIDEVAKALQTNEIYAAQQRQIMDQQLEINRLRAENERDRKTIREQEGKIQDRDSFIQGKGLEYEFESQIRSHTIHRHR